MKSLAIISTHPAQGKTTIAVNLAAGLARLGYKALLLEAGNPALIKLWFNIKEIGDELRNLKISTAMDFDILIASNPNIGSAEFMEYDFLIADHEQDGLEYPAMLNKTDRIAACTDLRLEEAAGLSSLDQRISSATANKHSIDLIIPTMINTKEWSNNSEVLFELMDYFGEVRIADMLPA